MTGFDAFKNADPDKEGDDLEPPADGVYTVALMDAGAFTSKAGNFLAKLAFRVQDTTSNGYEWTVLLGFAKQRQANFSKGQIRDLGIDVDSISSEDELDTTLKGRVGGFYYVEVKTSLGDGREFRNTYVTGPASSQPPASQPVPVTAGGGEPLNDGMDDVPF